VSDNVVKLPQPKQFKRHYKKTQYVVTFIPATRKWKWEVTITTTIRYDEVADTELKAFRAAEKFIDQHIKDK
jgi:hypothetical protein